jgi:PPOX class probable F420-dependent enzyme
MEAEEAREFVRRNRRAVIGTYRPDGSMHLTPILAGVDDRGLIEISSREDTRKVKNLRTDPRTALCVLPESFFGRSVQIDGEASILSLPDATEPLVDYYRRVAGKEHPDWEEYRRAMQRERRCLIKIEIERARES